MTRMRLRLLLPGLFGAAALLSAAPQLQSASAAPARVAIAVLPFENASGEANQDFLADGMTDEIAGALTRVPGFDVHARSSAYKFRGPARDLRAIGQALGTSNFVEGSVRKVGDRLRMSVRLLRTEGAPLWSEDYYAEEGAVFDLEEDIAGKIAGALKISTAGEKLVPNRTAQVAVYEDYLRARALARARGQKPMADAAVLLEQVVARDPNFAPAAALLAYDYDLTPLLNPALRSGNVQETTRVASLVIPKADALAKRAVMLDPKGGDGYVALAYAYMVQHKLLQADESFQKALLFDPNQSDGLHGYSQLLAAEGRINESLAMRQRLQAIEPSIPNYTADTAEIVWLDGDTETAIRMLNEFRPGRTAELTQILASVGRYRDAAGALREMPATNYPPGMLESAAKLLEGAPAKLPPDSLPRLGNLGFVFLHVGAPERVLEYYEGNLQAGYYQPISSTWFWHPSYAEVRKLPRFKAYVQKAGFVEVWRARGWPDACHPLDATDFACS
jgi:adenylate cyclase